MFNEKSRLQIRTGDQPEEWKDVSSFDIATAIPVFTINTLIPDSFDYVSCTYDANDNMTQAVFKTGGSTGTTVATLNMTYDANDNLSTVTKS